MHHRSSWRRIIGATLFLFITALPSAAAEKPILPAKVNQLIDTLFRSPEYEKGHLSPGGKYFAFIRQVGDQKVLDSYEFSSGKYYRLKPPRFTAIQVQLGLSQHIGSFSWIGPDQLLIRDDLGNIGFTGLWVSNGNLSQCQKLDTGNQGLFFFASLPYNPDTTYLYNGSGPTIYSPLWSLNKKSLTLHEAEPNPGKVIDWHFDQAGKIRLATVVESESKTSYLYRPPDTKKWQSIPLPNQSIPVVFNASGQNILVAIPGSDGRRQIHTFDLQSKQFSSPPIASKTYDIIPEIISDNNTGLPVGLVYLTTKPTILWLNEQYSQLHATLRKIYPETLILPLGVLENGEVLFAVTSDVLPETIYRFDNQKNEIHALIHALPDANNSKWAPMRPVSFTTRDGHTVHGYLTLPLDRRGDQKVPLVALSHGGPQARDGWGFDPEVQFLVALGYAVLQVNYRGSIGYGHDYELKNTVEVCEKSVNDVADGIRWAIAEGYADPSKIAAFGGSYGGYISLGIATRYPDLLAATVGFAGVYDWTAQYKETRKYSTEWFRWRSDYYIDAKKEPERYRPFNPVDAAQNVRCPVMLIHGGADYTVDIAQTNLMARALRKAQKPVAVIKDAEGVHGLPNEDARRVFYSNLAAFLLKHLPPEG